MEVCGSICGLKCESGYDWSTIVLTVVIFDLHCQCHTFLADHSAVVQLNKKEPGRGWVTGAKLTGQFEPFTDLTKCV